MRSSMTKSGLGAFFAVLISIIGADPTVSAADPKPASTSVLSGKVMNEAGEAIPEAVVRIAIPAADMRFVDPSSEHRQMEVRTSADGSYKFEIPETPKSTKVSVDAMKPGYRRLVGTLMSGGDETEVRVSPGAPVTANLVLKPAQYIKGVVVDEDGQPIAGVKVGANANSPMASGGVERTATNKDGVFEIFSYPAEPPVLVGGVTKGVISFTHPEHIGHTIPDIYALGPFERISLWVVLKNGHRLAGQVVDAAGKPVPNVMVRSLPPLDYRNRKAVLTNAEGRFNLLGVTPGAKLLSVYANDIEQKAEMPLDVKSDQTELVIKLQKMAIESPPTTYEVLGMRLTDVTPELNQAFGLHMKEGALIMNPGPDSQRLKIGELAKGYVFWMVGDTHVANVREFVEQILKEVETQTADRSKTRRLVESAVEAATGQGERFQVRVVYTLSTLEFDGTNTQYLDLGRGDVDQLKEVQRRFKPKESSERK